MGLNDSEACDLLTDGVDEATDAIFVSEIYGKRHYGERMATGESQTRKLNDNVLDKIPQLYAAVLEFAYNARKFIKHGKAGRVLRFYKMPLKVFQENVDSMRTKKNELTLVAGIGFEEVARDSLKHIQDGLKKLDELEKIGENLKELQKEQAKHRQEKEEAQALQEYKNQVQWFRTSAEPVKRNVKNLGRKQAGTCRWIFKEPDYQKWQETSEIPLLWISASQGFGKSILVSSIIEALETDIRNAGSEPTATPAPELIYFFVQTGSDDTQVSGRILQHLFFQLFLKAEQQKKLRDKCTEIVKVAKEKIRGSRTGTDTTCNMSVQELRPLFESVMQAFEKQIIVVIDGLDECKDLEKENFLSLIKDISQTGLPVKLLVASRPEPFIEKAFTDITRIEVSKDKTQKDIQLYLIEEVRSIQHIPSGERKRAAQLIHKKADGMFRYANLAIDFLKHPFRGTFQQKLARFPDAMEDFYRQNLEKMDEKMRELLLIALRWRIYGQGSGVDYTAVQVAEEFEHKYEDPVSTDENDATSQKEGGDGGDDDDDWWPDEEPERQTQKPGEGNKSQESEFQLTLELLRRAGGEFLAIGQNNILELRHKSVQDFIIDYAEKVTKKLIHRKTFCSSCLDRERSAFIYQLGPRQAHLHMALISPSKQQTVPGGAFT
ncbi:hypothetical protein K440DRAFT_27512 [Wilcoxina mikolae CBS 423.85]|nr:hypothetical protein K440DRAFT_27512 [Wilcoxina mikolae CBS 423.85]